MKHILFVFAAVWLASQSATCAAAAAPPAGKPNLVVIFIDDMGYGDIGPYGSTLNRTPHLDRMAAEGMKLTSFYAAPVCSVSRAQLLTGCYGARVSVPGVYFPGHAEGLNPQEDTIADLVKPQGYATMCIGKWHVGDQPEFLPTKQGFDHYLGIPYSNDMQRKSLETGERVVPLVRDDQVAELLTDEAQTTVTERYTDEAVKFIRQHHNTPFFLYFPHTAVHTPIFPGAAFQGKSANGRYGDWVEEVDASVGRVLDTLRELNLEQSTLVIFTTDNGPWLIKGSDGGTAGPLRGGKGSTWEGGVRVPTVAWWPGRIAAGTTCDAVAGTIDLLPTLVNLAHGKLPAAIWVLGLAWAALGWRNRLRPGWLAIGLGCLGAVIGPSIGLGEYEWLLAPGLLTAAGLMAVSVPARQTPLLALGTVGAFGYITWAVVHYFRDSLGVPVALVIVGAVFLALAVLAGVLATKNRGKPVRFPE